MRNRQLQQEVVLAKIEAKEKNEFVVPSDLTYLVNKAGNINKLALINSLAKQEDDINSLLDKDDNTPLHTAVIGGNVRIVQFLVEHWNADGNAKNKAGETPLDLAKKLEMKTIVDFLNHNIL